MMIIGHREEVAWERDAPDVQPLHAEAPVIEVIERVGADQAGSMGMVARVFCKGRHDCAAAAVPFTPGCSLARQR